MRFSKVRRVESGSLPQKWKGGWRVLNFSCVSAGESGEPLPPKHQRRKETDDPQRVARSLSFWKSLSKRPDRWTVLPREDASHSPRCSHADRGAWADIGNWGWSKWIGEHPLSERRYRRPRSRFGIGQATARLGEIKLRLRRRVRPPIFRRQFQCGDPI